MGAQYTQGSLVTVSVTTLNQNGMPLVPDNMLPPLYDIDYITPTTPIRIVNEGVMTPINASWYYANVDSSLLGIGSYLVTATAIVGGIPLTYTDRFDIVAGNGFTLLPIDPISRLRLRLLDNNPDPTRWVWSDQELSEYLQDSLDEFNSAPARTNFYWMNIPMQYMTNILKGAQIAALEGAAIKVAHRPISSNDKGITVNLPQQAATYQSIARMLREQQDPERLRIKRNIPKRAGLMVTPNMPYMSYPPIRATDRTWW